MLAGFEAKRTGRKRGADVSRWPIDSMLDGCGHSFVVWMQPKAKVVHQPEWKKRLGGASAARLRRVGDGDLGMHLEKGTRTGIYLTGVCIQIDIEALRTTG